jgi:hypothetical protein
MDTILNQFYWSLQALAQPAADQSALFPMFVVVADELALDLDHWLQVVQSNQLVVPPETLRAALEINRLLGEISGRHNAQEWTIEALNTSPTWQKVRTRAREALFAAGLPLDPPPPGRSKYASVPGV